MKIYDSKLPFEMTHNSKPKHLKKRLTVFTTARLGKATRPFAILRFGKNLMVYDVVDSGGLILYYWMLTYDSEAEGGRPHLSQE